MFTNKNSANSNRRSDRAGNHGNPRDSNYANKEKSSKSIGLKDKRNKPYSLNERGRNSRSHRNDNHQSQNQRTRQDLQSRYSRQINSIEYFNHTLLKELSNKESDDIITILRPKETEFKQFLLQKMVVPDFIVLTLKILTKVCQANFTEIVTSILSHACSVNFLENIVFYLQKLIFETDLEKTTNEFYHKDKDNFWSNLVELFKKMIEIFPTTTCYQLTPTLDKVEQIIKCLEMNKNYTINDDIKSTISNMSIDLKNKMKNSNEENKAKASTSTEIDTEVRPPPEDFRSLSIIPTIEDLYDKKPYLRRCKVKDPYDSVDHYLDVQFRLLREDFLSPLRNGLKEYLREDKRYQNRDLRVYRNVKLVVPEASKNNVGILANFGIIKRIKWQYSKRFMHGGLVLLSRDNFNNILFATIINRDVKDLEKGCILIEPCEGTTVTEDMYKAQFVMLESKIYFEPYLAVLNAMQQMNEQNFPMEHYLIKTGTREQLPAYLLNQTTLTYKGLKLPVKDLQSWPNANTLGMDDTQYNAFKCALTQEFSVIQGPPGCGKTFIALEIVNALLENKQCWETNGPIVVVCLTNHALDQFLEGILKHNYTNSIVRIGSRSKSEILKPYTLMQRRRLREWKNDADDLMYATKRKLEDILRNIEKAHLCINYLTNPKIIVPTACFKKYCAQILPPKIKYDGDLITWLVGTDITLHPIKENAAAQSLKKNTQNIPNWVFEYFENYYTMDDDLELDYEMPNDNSFKPIDLLQIIDTEIKYCNDKVREIISERYKNNKQKNIQISELERHILTLQEHRRSVQRNLEKHPLINPQENFLIQDTNWRSYWDWVKLSYERALDEITQLMVQYRQTNRELNEAKQIVDLATIRRHKIVGLTTNGAAKLHSSLRSLHAPIVLVEEAAEILESHVVCSMTKHCQQVILIGDHKQLRPKVSVYELGTKYNLNISLFERMVNVRGNCAQLAHQHRMRPEFAKLITPSIYETLYNHESVLNYPNVKGVVKNLFFLNHENREINHDNEDSWVNKHEVDFLISFAIHLVKQGYNPSDITILCTYTGQLFAFIKQAQNFMILKNVRISSIDNYQGEENTIVLLSLVRNNGEGKIGFLKAENRVCVALSRAREGLYIMGNMDDLIVQNKIWPKVKKVLEDEEAIGDLLELRCQVHSDQVIKVKNANDFLHCPEGGCLKKCDADLSCGHSCTKICHVLDREHKKYKCKESCTKTCPNDHPCPLKCLEGCKPCQIAVERELKCGHTAKMLCSTDPLTFLCNVEVSVILPNCQHEIKKPCYQSVEESKCSYPCESRLPCGHQCRLNCHVTDDPEHIKYQCHKACPKNNRDCVNNHPCKKRCFEECEPCFTRVIKKRFCGHIIKNIECSTDAKEKLCMMPCKLKLECGHLCRLKCSIQCGNCQERVKKSSDCGHEIYVRCCDQATASRCYNKCPKKLPCGHPCTTKCKDPCTINCKEKVKLNSPGLCGHTFSVPCYLKETDPKSSQLLQYCNEPCTEQLSCSHQCKGSCSKCKQGRFHAPCGQPCNNLLICGHPCTIPCRSECQPCNKPCELQCSHSKCRRKCGIPCIPCIEPCEWRCKHRRCTKRCSELCNIEPCNEPCKKLLKCKHPCVGFCGDPCPPLCRICDKEELIEFILLGIEEEPDARFIYLEDCKHCIESNGLMKWVMEQKDTTDQAVGIKTCPKCKTPIRKCMRLMNHLKRTFVDIQYIKRKNFGDLNQLKNQQSQHVETLKGYMTNQILLKEIPQLKNLLQNLLNQAIPINKQKRQILCAQEILAFEMILKLLKEIFNSLSLVNYKINNTVNSHKLVKNQIIMLVENFPLKWQISNQEINDINLELGRLKYIISFHQTDIDGINNGLANEAQKEYDAVTAKLVSIEKFTPEMETEVTKCMSDLGVKKKNITFDRQIIRKAMGFSAGHWFKCPNGHFYTIGECGGAMELSRCPDCKATIGGQSHRLTAGNNLASEMDGATAPAWPTALQ